MKLMSIRPWAFAIAVLSLAASSASGQMLMQEPLGDTKEPTLSLFLTTLPPGHTSPEHQHPGVVFIYILEGEIESQVESSPPKIYRSGEFFHERPMQVHRIFRNVSQTTPAKYLSFSNIATPNLSPQSTRPRLVNPGVVNALLLLQDSLKDLADQEVTLAKSTIAPGAAPTSPSTRAHQHSGLSSRTSLREMSRAKSIQTLPRSIIRVTYSSSPRCTLTVSFATSARPSLPKC